jgi:hypothetical protein
LITAFWKTKFKKSDLKKHSKKFFITPLTELLRKVCLPEVNLTFSDELSQNQKTQPTLTSKSKALSKKSNCATR